MSVLAAFRRLLGRVFGRNPNRGRTAIPGFAPPEPPDRATSELAERGARAHYQGPPAGEPHAAHLLQALTSHLTHLFRTDEELRAAQASAVDAQNALADATNELPRVLGRTQDALHLGAGVPSTADTPQESARWAIGARARAERRDAEETIASARRASVDAARHLATVESRSIDRLAEAAAAGLVPINAYLAAFDQARAHDSRPGIGLLGEATVHDLVRRAVTPIDVRGPDNSA